jgi:hypothetical protein
MIAASKNHRNQLIMEIMVPGKKITRQGGRAIVYVTDPKMSVYLFPLRSWATKSSIPPLICWFR